MVVQKREIDLKANKARARGSGSNGAAGLTEVTEQRRERTDHVALGEVEGSFTDLCF